jgi:hypothetical protein
MNWGMVDNEIHEYTMNTLEFVILRRDTLTLNSLSKYE